MRLVSIPLIAALVIAPAFVRPAAPELPVATVIGRMMKSMTDYALSLPLLPLTIEHLSQQDWNEPSLDDIKTLPSVAIELVCRALTDAAQANGLPVGFLARLIWTESRFRQRVVSQAGAQGVAQFMPATAVEYGLDDPFDPLQALPASAKFLRRLRDQFGNLGLAAAAYNAGGGRVQDWLAQRKSLPVETRNYVLSVTGQSPEDWTRSEADIGLEHKLPRAAPCEGEAGLSTQSKPIAMKVALSPVAGEILRKAEIAAEAARKARQEAERRALAALKKKGKPTLVAEKHATRLAKAMTTAKAAKVRLAPASR